MPSSNVAPLTLTCPRGSALTYSGTHVTSAGSSTAVDISGWTIKFTARDSQGNQIVQKTASIVSGPAGTYTIAVTHADSMLPIGSNYEADVQRTDSGSETLMALGTWSITKEILYP